VYEWDSYILILEEITRKELFTRKGKKKITPYIEPRSNHTIFF
jgi:hypothetical protein